MTDAAVVYTDVKDSAAAGRALGTQIREALGGYLPDALIVFASSSYDYRELLAALDSSCHPAVLVGCSSAGEFITASQGVESACAVALRASDMVFAASIGRGLRADTTQAANELVASFEGLDRHDFLYRSALILTDALAGHADSLVEHLTLHTAGTYQFFGGGAGDDGRFSTTHVFYGNEIVDDAVVALEILSNKPLGVGVCHGWQPASPRMRVTEAEGMRLVSVNATPAVEIFLDYAVQTNQTFDHENPLPFFIHNVIGIDDELEQRLRMPLVLNDDGSIVCAADVPNGATVQIMCSSAISAVDAAAIATQAALRQIEGYRPKVAFVFDCVATRLRLGHEFSTELAVVGGVLGETPFVGFNTYGQVARAEGQFSGFHNCTAVVCVIPE